MDKSEVIILSSDDETDTHHFEKYLSNVTVTPVSEKSDKILKACFSDSKTSQEDINWNICRVLSKKARISNKNPKKQCVNVSNENPEVVDLVDCLDKSPVQQDCGSNETTEQVQSHLKLDVVNIDTTKDSNRCSLNKSDNNDGAEKPKKLQDSQTANIETNCKTIIHKIKRTGNKSEEISEVPVVEIQNASTDDMSNQNSTKNLNPFIEFVEFCGSLETVVSDRIRLTKKLMKRYGEADPSYTETQEFRDLIEKCRKKVNEHNLYLIAKDITAELSFRKQIKVTPSRIENSQGNYENNKKVEPVQEKDEKKHKKCTKFIKKILKKLDKLGSKIRELEVEEVDLSDEEGSSYVRLQRYRERFCQIYKKLCKYTNEIPDADNLHNQRICFTESKYPTINKCIEVWLNKIKRFPDFTDIMKLLESQSSSLGLPTNRESLRIIAIEIFQQVGAMLQRRRKYELWNSFCGFLEDQVDPATKDPVLEKVLRNHFEIRIRKEQEIFQQYSELQERERLEPEEVPDEEANRSPVESGNEDEKEIEEIENDILKRLDLAIKEDTKKEDSRNKCNDWGENKNDSVGEAEQKGTPDSAKQKQSKNNYKNCKSLKWRSENLGKSKSENSNSIDSNGRPENSREKTPKAAAEESSDSNEGLKALEESNKNDSDLELLAEETNEDVNSEKKVGKTMEAAGAFKTPVKRTSNSVNECLGKKKCINYWNSEENSFDQFVGENENFSDKSNESFDVHYCQVFADSVFDSFSKKKKDGNKRKVFRDMTNINRLMELHGKGRNGSGLFTPSFFLPAIREFDKPLWKRKFKVSFRMVGSRNEKCALSQEGKTEKSMKSDAGRESDKKDIQNNSDRGRDERDGFFSGHGGGSHEDDDKDRNRKNGRTGNDISENKPEEEEEDEDERDESEMETTKTEASKHSRSKDKIEETRESNATTEWPSEVSPPNKTADSLMFNNILRKDKGEEAQEGIVEKETEISKKKERIDILGKKKEVEEPKESRGLEQKGSKSKKREVFNKRGSGKAQDGKKYSLELKTGKSLTEKESNPVVQENSEREIRTEEVVEVEKLSAIGSIVPKRRSKRLSKEAETKKENESINEKRTQQEGDKDRAGIARKSLQVQNVGGKVHRKNAPSASDEERVKRFLMHSPSSISITPPRKLTFSKPPSEAALKALATLRNLKGISATIVKGKPKSEDDVMVIGGSYKRQADQKLSSTKRNRSDLPVISNVQSIYCTTPKIVTIEGNVSGFENYSTELTSNEKSECDSSSIKISNVWGSLPNNFMQSMQDDESVKPGCSSQNYQQSHSQSWNVAKKKSTKKKVEYVVLE